MWKCPGWATINYWVPINVLNTGLETWYTKLKKCPCSWVNYRMTGRKELNKCLLILIFIYYFNFGYGYFWRATPVVWPQ